ncbi:MAG: hypothetical protein FD143_716 [Ignavibacteria bacterium]|nr:MAG: hypothetical protein FD143_716 [Ignavibacteria bacterium]KAF0161329.1 MAG: hypothetical protein FD188_917 [Ignavibacteria bacterium]
MKKTLCVLMLMSSLQFAQQLEFFPNELNVNPFVANVIEPKLGFMFKTEVNELRLDIGNTVDIALLRTTSGVISMGADLFTWTLLRKENNFHFPVDAVDYLFGLNFGFKKSVHDYAFGARLRISHISAHFVDGHYDKEKLSWRNTRTPRVYSREFIELMPFYQYKHLRMYAGFTYLFNVNPKVEQRDLYQLGFDYFRKDFITDYLSPFIAYDVKISGSTKSTPNHSFNAGIKFGNPEGKGISLYFHYYSGWSIHGQYFDYREKYSGIGVNLDL